MLGIGGAGMSSLARLYRSLGFSVFGCDRAFSKSVQTLCAEGISVTLPPLHLPQGVDALVYTLAVSAEDPLLLEAVSRGLPIYSRASAIAEATHAFRRVVAIAGTHGKSTTTAMTAAVLSAGGLMPTVLCGADLPEEASGFLDGGRELLLLEACEYRDSLLWMRPTTAVVLNCEYDHPDYFRDASAVHDSFRRFLSLPTVHTRISGATTLPGVRFSASDREAALYADAIQEENGCCSFVPVYRGKRFPRIALSVPGRHNLENALAALLVGLLEGVAFESASRALSDFSGVLGRMEYRGCVRGCRIYDDYAHHPTELCAALRTARSMTAGRLLVLFQGHTYSRTRAYYGDFLSVLSLADCVFIADIYPARETDTLGMSGEKMARDAGGVYVEGPRDAAEKIGKELREGDLVLTLGAGEARLAIPYLLEGGEKL